MDRRSMLESALEEVVEPLDEPQEEVIDEIQEEPQNEPQKEPTEEPQNEPQEEEPEEFVEAKVTKPTTWKKEYTTIWDKLEKGEQVSKEEFTKFAEYANKREDEYKKGVSTYRQEAEHAKTLRSALEPYAGELQKKNIKPEEYISALARADQMLTHAPYEQKVQMFNQLAQSYGINLGNQVQPQDHLVQQLYTVNQEVATIKQRYEQEEQSRLYNEIEKVRSNSEKFPHFDEVREDMAQLLENGIVKDLETAYTKAIRLNEDVWQKEQERLVKTATSQREKQMQVSKAKAKAVSPRSVTPTSVVATSDKKDRKSILEAQLNELGGRI
jgi:hypothetical protein